MKCWVPLLALAGALLAPVAPAFAQSADVARLEREIEALRAAQGALRDELREIRSLLQRAAAAPAAEGAPNLAGMTLSLERAQFRGAADAKVVLVEFSDFQCPFCARYAQATYPQIVRDYVDAGKVRYAFMNFPLESLHPLAFNQHVAAACAADQGRFWDMHDRLFSHQRASGAAALAGEASALGLDMAAFRACIASERHAAAIRDAMGIGSALGITGTPTFVIGIATAGDGIKAQRMIVGAKPYAAFREALDGALATTVGEISAAGRARLAVGSSR
jgi:protein-disulfide isomerase